MRTKRHTLVVVAATIGVAGCGGGDSPSCVDFDADRLPMDADVVELSTAVTDLPDEFENDPPVPSALMVESVSEVSAVEVGGGQEIDVENGVSVALIGDVSTADSGFYRSLVGACSEAGFSRDPSGDGEFESIVGFTGDRAVRFHLEDGRLIVSEYDR